MGPGFAFLTSEYGGRDVGGMGVPGRRADQGDTEGENLARSLAEQNIERRRGPKKLGPLFLRIPRDPGV